MASPMREKRAWPTREKDAESKETAAFEATVAVARDTVARSGAVLSSAKEDLTDHQRWLHTQSAAVEADRARHERWLQRQREHRLALARRERTRRRRQLMRQRAVRAMQQAAWATALFVKSLVVLVVAKTGAGLRYTARSIARGAAWVVGRLRDVALYVANGVAGGTRWTAGRLGALALWTGKWLSAGFTWSAARTGSGARASGRAIATGSSFVAAKAGAGARTTGRGLATGSSFAVAKAGTGARATGRAIAAASSLVAAKAGVFGRAAGRSLGSGVSAASAKASVAAGATGRSASRGLSAVSAKASVLGRASKKKLSAGYAWSKAKAAAFAPALYVSVAKMGRQAERYARAGAARAESVFEKAKVAMPAEWAAQAVEVYGPHPEGFEIDGRLANDPIENDGTHREELKTGDLAANESYAAAPEIVGPLVDNENTLSSLLAKARTKDVDLSQMLIIAGAVLLVCGGLLLGGGLILRASPRPAEPEAPHGIAWSFEDADLPLEQRALFTLSGTPQSFRINGLSISGENFSDLPMTSVHGVLKPDVHRPDLKLALTVERSAAVAAGEGDTESQALEVVPAGAIPPHTPFKLVFPFPPEAMNGEDGITVEEFFDSYGGLVLNLHYEMEGKPRALIQYLSPELLKGQLDEVQAEAGGS
jgi:hypothetical protein